MIVLWKSQGQVVNNNGGNKHITVYYHGESYAIAIGRDLKKRGLKTGQENIIALPKSLRKWQNPSPSQVTTRRNFLWEKRAKS